MLLVDECPKDPCLNGERGSHPALTCDTSPYFLRRRFELSKESGYGYRVRFSFLPSFPYMFCWAPIRLIVILYYGDYHFLVQWGLSLSSTMGTITFKLIVPWNC